MNDLIERIYRRILLMIGRSRVTTVNDSGSVQELQIKLSNDEIRDNTPRLAEFGFSSNPPIGSDAIAIFVGGDRSSGVVIATGHQPSRPVGLLSGETIVYCQDGKYIKFTASGGIVIEAKNQPVVVNNATLLTINAATGVLMNTPYLHVTGDIIDNYGTNSHNLAQMRSIYNGHAHPDPQGENTGTPDSTQ